MDELIALLDRAQTRLEELLEENGDDLKLLAAWDNVSAALAALGTEEGN
jgi:hypothetical protein